MEDRCLTTFRACTATAIRSLLVFFLFPVFHSLFPVFCSLSLAGDWITGGGNPQRNGIADVSAPQSPDILWQTSLFSSYGQQVYLWNDKLVTYRYDFTNGPIICHDLATGETLWTRDLGLPGGRSLPVGFRDDRVYAVELTSPYPDTLYCLDAADGSTVWTARLNAHMYISESVTFAENGDLIVSCADFRSARIDRLTGDTLWTTPRVWPVSGSADLTVSGTSFYGFGGALVGGALKVYAFDLATGRKRDSTFIEDTHPGGSAPYGNIIVGPDGVLYAHRCADNVTAIEDLGDSLHIRWVHEVSDDPAALWAQLACGPDSSVYCFSSGRVVRLNPRTGAARDSSVFIKDPAATFAAHLAVGADGIVYCANGGYSGGALHAFTPDLQLIWTDSVPNISTSNPAIGRNGELATAGGGTILRVYRASGAVAVPARSESLRLPEAAPNPLRNSTVIRFPAADRLVIRDAAGRFVCRLHVVNGQACWNGTGESGTRVPAGIYFCRDEHEARPVTLVLRRL